jgi:hypothetical protein
VFFSISRFALSGTSNQNRIRIFIEKQNIKRFYIVAFLTALGFSSFLVLENGVNKLFQDYVGVSVGDMNQNNVYNVKYCDSFLTEQTYVLKFSLASSFYVYCGLFKWFNLINNVLNNGLFLIVSIFVDIFMVRFSSKVIKEKKALNSPHLNEAIAYKAKVNKMIITNGTLHFCSHFPEFFATLVFYIVKSNDILYFCYMTFDCTSIIELAQAFHFISIGFQFFIFLIFDQNFKKMYLH